MGVKLTFRKSFECAGGAGIGNANLEPCTMEGEPIANVLTCSVEGGAERSLVMTIKVMVTETFAQNTATRLRK